MNLLVFILEDFACEFLVSVQSKESENITCLVKLRSKINYRGSLTEQYG